MLSTEGNQKPDAESDAYYYDKMSESKDGLQSYENRKFIKADLKQTASMNRQ